MLQAESREPEAGASLSSPGPYALALLGADDTLSLSLVWPLLIPCSVTLPALF